MKKLLILFLVSSCVLIGSSELAGQDTGNTLSGYVLDKNSGETLPGVTIFFPSLNLGASTDLEGNFLIKGVPSGVHELQVSYIGYQTISIKDMKIEKGENMFNALLEEATNLLNEIVVTSVKRMNSEIAMVQSVKSAQVVMSGMSGIQISKSQDRNAAEVVKRIPGVTLLDERLIVVRGLPSRYNNVWINNTSVPGTEADSRSFSFDLLPANQLESIMVVKSQSADLPADFAGGFVKITTGSMPDENDLKLSVGTGISSTTHFGDFFINKGSSTDLLGFDSGERSLGSFVPKRLDNNNPDLVSQVTSQGFRENWQVTKKNPIPDIRFSVMLNRALKTKKGNDIGVTGALNYTHGLHVYRDMQNSRFGAYNMVEDKPEFIYNYSDNQFNSDSRGGAMLNLSWMDDNNKIEFRNIFNILGKNRYTTREGWQNVSALYNQEKYEYLYTSRATLTSQLTGRHDSGNGFAEWGISYSYANMNQPDRRIINREENSIYGDLFFGEMAIDQNEITRDFVKLDEKIISPSASYNIKLPGLEYEMDFKVGLMGEYRAREYNNRQFFYRYNRYSMPSGFVYQDPVSQILTKENYGWDKLYVYEDTDNRNSYKGESYNGAAYVMMNLVAGKFRVNTGLRLESSNMVLTSYDKIYEFTSFDTKYNITQLYPSFNAAYNFDEKKLVRIAYGRSVNKQEFREVSPSVYYDFNLFSDVKGNPDLKHATIDNADLRFEYYPSAGEYATFALFYKHFANPIEWTYLDAGGSYTYTFENAKEANNFGIEADIRKELGCLGLDGFSFGLNAAYIWSKVSFDKDRSLERDRAMQGQSPYIVNASLYYDNKEIGLSAGIMYNRIGKRIVGIGRADTGSGASINNDVPDTYELPRDLLDLTVSKKISDNLSVKLKASDLLAQKVIFRQYPKFLDNSGDLHSREQTSKEFSPGSYFSFSLQFNF